MNVSRDRIDSKYLPDCIWNGGFIALLCVVSDAKVLEDVVATVRAGPLQLRGVLCLWDFLKCVVDTQLEQAIRTGGFRQTQDTFL